MKRVDWYELANPEGWVYGSNRCPIFQDTINISRIGIDIIRKSRKLSDVIPHMKLQKIQIHIIPKMLEIRERMNRMIGIFENLCIRCFEPTEKDLETESISQPTEINEETEEDMGTEDVMKMLGDLKPEDVGAKDIARKIIEKKVNPLTEFKKTIRTVKERIDIQQLYKVNTITVNQVIDLLIEIDNTMSFIASSLEFGRKHGGNKEGVKKSVLYFMDMIPERTVPIRRGKAS